MEIRNYQEHDCIEIVDLFYNTVHSINSKDYTPEQVDAWAIKNPDLNQWNKSLLENDTIVAVEEKQIVGFGDIDKSGYINRLFVHNNHQGKGVATQICNELEKRANGSDVYVHASITAKGFFEKRGYKILEKQQVKLRGIFLTNYVMVRTI